VLAVSQRIDAAHPEAAERAVLAARVESAVLTRVGRLDTHVVSAADGICAIRLRPALTSQHGVAPLEPVTEEPVVAQRVAGDVGAVVGLLVARVERARHGVEAGRPAGATPGHGVARLGPVAESAVIAGS
jgi:hypothetical protein